MSPTADDVRRQLDRLLASAGFANAGRMSRFLKFVVERTLAGDGERLKEYVIGIEVFDRDTDYDPRVDSIVRVEAARLRSKLAEYYAGEGRDDLLIVSLPKGGYAPIVTVDDRSAALNGAAAANGTAVTNGTAALAPLPSRPEHAPAEQPRSARRRWALAALIVAGVAAAVVAWVPSRPAGPLRLRIAVLPFTLAANDANAANGALAQRLTEGVTAELVRDGRFNVVASSAARAEYSAARRPLDIGAALDADILIQARVRTDGDAVHVETYAIDGDREEKLWVDAFAGTAGDTDALEREIAAAVGNALRTDEAAFRR